jgi:glutamine amidotransferase
MAKRIVVVDYGVGNLYSVQRALEVSGAEEVVLGSDPQVIGEADGLVLPGVGAFADGMRGLRERGLIEPIKAYAQSGQPLLGICLGMQMLAMASEEFGHHEGLGLIPGEVLAIPHRSTDDQPIKVPFIGWATITPEHPKACEGSVLQSHVASAAVYLVHSFYLNPSDPKHLLATYGFGGYRITAAVRRDNITGLQFHPEKSGRVGLEIMRHFVGQRRVALPGRSSERST